MKKRKTDKKFFFTDRSHSENKKRKYAFFAVFALLIVVATAFVSLNFYQLMLITGDSMLPSYHNMQFVVLDKTEHEYIAGDVIAYRCPAVDTVVVKRLAACPGDRVEIIDKKLYVNGEISPVFCDAVFDYAGVLDNGVALEQNEYFTIGDNISLSKDCRYAEMGNVAAADIIGKIIGT